jgi:hypothetical protein
MITRQAKGLFSRLLGLSLAGGLVLASLVARGDDANLSYAPGDYAFVRTLRKTMQTAKWRDADTLAARLAAWRSDINVFKPGQNPVSDRYIVTCYGGVIDLRHFLYTACKVLSPSGSDYWKGLDRPIEARYANRPYRNPFARKFKGPEFHIQLALYDSYCVERGREYELAQVVEKPEMVKALAEGQFWQCTPEDLPSSALGAEFARQLMNRRDPLTINIEAELTKFLAPFRPVPDKVRDQISHSEAIFGMEDTALKEIPIEKLLWFKAEPHVFTELINQKAEKAGLGKLCDDVKDGNAGLAKAGYEVRKTVGGLPLEIYPIKK